METNENVQEFLDNNFQDSKVVLNLDLEQFNKNPMMSKILNNQPTSLLSGSLLYLVDKENFTKKTAVYIPEPDNIASAEIHEEYNDLEKAEMIFALCLMVGDTDVSDEYIENAHFYLDMDRAMQYYGLEV